MYVGILGHSRDWSRCPLWQAEQYCICNHQIFSQSLLASRYGIVPHTQSKVLDIPACPITNYPGLLALTVIPICTPRARKYNELSLVGLFFSHLDWETLLSSSACILLHVDHLSKKWLVAFSINDDIQESMSCTKCARAIHLIKSSIGHSIK